MKAVIWIIILAIFASCTKSTGSAATRLVRTEATDYNGNVFYTEYGYDNQGRIITITNHENSDPAV